MKLKLICLLLLTATAFATPVHITSTTHLTVTAPPTGTSRPSYNTGNGFYVLNGNLYDPTGVAFRIRGVDRAHYDSNSSAGIVKSKANAVRTFVTDAYGDTWPELENIVYTQNVQNQELAIPTFAGNATVPATSCSSDNSVLSGAVAVWVAEASVWTPINRYMIVNIANEWGPSNSTVWRDQYISAIASMRAAGYTGTLMIDAGGCGQDIADLLNYSTAVFNSDSQKNIIFSLHIYGNIPTASVPGDLASLRSLANSAGMAFVIGEFGPGRNIGPSPTTTTPGQIITASENATIGWIGWAWDDNDLAGDMSDDNSFSMTYGTDGGNGSYVVTADLTIYGQDVVLNPTYGLQAIAQKPNW